MPEQNQTAPDPKEPQKGDTTEFPPTNPGIVDPGVNTPFPGAKPEIEHPETGPQPEIDNPPAPNPPRPI